MNLNQCPICGHIPEDQRDEFISSLHATCKIFQKGEVIARQGDRVGALYILYKGAVKTEMITESGSILAVDTLHAPCPLAPAFLFAENNRFPVDVIAIEACELLSIPKNRVMERLAVDEQFLKNYMAFNANRTQFLSEKLQLLSIKTIKGKLAYYIRQRADNGRFVMDRNQTALAEYFGVTRPSLARSFSEMIQEGAITREGRILDSEKLQCYIFH